MPHLGVANARVHSVMFRKSAFMIIYYISYVLYHHILYILYHQMLYTYITLHHIETCLRPSTLPTCAAVSLLSGSSCSRLLRKSSKLSREELTFCKISSTDLSF